MARNMVAQLVKLDAGPAYLGTAKAVCHDGDFHLGGWSWYELPS